MSKKEIAIYRLPIGTSPQTGSVRVVIDRNKQVYIHKQKVVSAEPAGDFFVLILANDQAYYVKQEDYKILRGV